MVNNRNQSKKKLDIKKDVAYVFKFSNEPLFQKDDFRYFEKQYESNQMALTVKSENDLIVPIYTPQLAMILTNTEISAWNRDEQKEDIFNGVKYLNSYIEGYKKGLVFFEENFNANPTILYGQHASAYIRDLHDHYFHKGMNKISGWNDAMRTYPLVITHEVIKKIGYYSSLIHSVDEIKNRYSQIFKQYKFDKHFKAGKSIQNPIAKLELSAIFEKTSHYNQIMELLVKHGQCHPNTYLWKDDKAAYKKIIVGLIKLLHLYKYFIDNTKPSSKEIKEIAKNTFSVDISIATIDHTKNEDLDKRSLSFIPYASELQ